jgi:multiple sugar transport system ATP-binding protein
VASITIENVWKIYNEGKREHEVQAVKDLSLECQDGEFLALLGPSGCGKTSTMRMIAGLEEITRGNIWIGDKLVNKLHPSQRDIAMVFESYALYEHLSVYENIAFPLKVRKLSKDEMERRISRVAEILDIGDLLKRMPAHLSDGQKQRISIGRAIVRQPVAFLMDEPISHLDAMLRSKMRREITHLQKELGITTVYVTHDQLEATVMADRIAVMNLGELQQLETPKVIFENPANTFVADFVGEPPMNFINMEITNCSDHIELNGSGVSIVVREKSRSQALLNLNQPNITLGIRPMYIETKMSSTPGSFPTQVYAVEPLDELNIITTKLSGNGKHMLIETEPLVRPEFDDVIWLTIPEEKVLFFHPTTGKNLLNQNE